MIGRIFITLTGLASLIIVLFVLVILANITLHGLGTLSWEFISAAPAHGMSAGGIFPAIFGTILLVLLMTIAVIPLGVLTAVYLSEYAPKKSWLLSLIRLAIQNLAGVPSIVFGLFGLGFFIQFVGVGIDSFFYDSQIVFGQPAIIWAALTLALLTLPTVVISTEEAIRIIPNSHREVAYSLGATRLQVVRKIIIPQAIGGIMTGGILAVSRGAGEVAPILFTGAAYFLPYLPTKLNDQFMELGYHVYVMATQSPDVEATKPILYGTVLVLLILTFSLNFTAIWIRSRIRRKMRALR